MYVLTAIGLTGLLVWAALKEKPPGALAVAGVLLGASALFACMIVLPVLILGGPVAVGAVGLLRRRLGMRRLKTLSWGLGGLAAVGAVDAGIYYETEYRPYRDGILAAREAYPPTPRGERLREPAPNPLEQAEPHPATLAWEEAFAADELSFYPRKENHWERNGSLRTLHSAHLTFASRFATRPGFGVTRMSPRMWHPGPDDLARQTFPRFPQPTEEPLWPDEALATPAAFETGEPASAELHDWHADRGIDFANDAGFGLLATGEDGASGFFGDEAALPPDADLGLAPYLVGFEPHLSHEDPGEPLAPEWRLLRVELIGLVSGPDPVAYHSAELPRMGEASRHIVRTLTLFEEAALPKLAAGEWVVVAEEGDRLRAVGALPAAAACAECHGVPQGRLLGALSYDFDRGAAAEESADAVPR